MSSPSRTGSLESLRLGNRMRVIDVLRQRGAVSRAQIARDAGLSRTTVGSLVADLMADGFVTERATDDGPRGPEGGRPGVLVALDRSAGALVGIDFGHRHLRVAVSDLAYEVLGERFVSLEVDQAGLEGLDAAARLVGELLEEAGVDPARVLAGGMGLPAPVERPSGLVRSRQILPSLDEHDAAAEMEARLGYPVHLDNDANVGALGEATFGAGAGFEVMAYLRMSAGIGAGLVFGGRPFRGARGFAGEIGHVLVDEDGPICRCGNRGCLETFVAAPRVVELLQRSHGPLSVAGMLELAAAGDGGARRALQDAGRVVGQVTAAMCNYLNPDVVVVGGELSPAGEVLLEPMREAVQRFAVPAAARSVRIVCGVLGERAEVLGALALAGHEAHEPLAHVTTQAPPTRRSS
jgi:predicted NBD/HSP70 family sugar kinase